MKGVKYFAAAVAAVVMSGSAFAADLPVREPAPAPVMAAPIFTWEGFYVGLQGGYGWGSDRWTSLAGGGLVTDRLPGAVFSYNQNGWLAGGQVGYNFQYYNWVVGIEGSLAYSDIKGNTLSIFGAADDRFRTSFRTIGSVASRLGYSFGPTLLYVKGGYAFVNTRRSIVDAVPANTGAVAVSRWHQGAVLGAGVEYAINRNWSAGLEYNYYWLDRKNTLYTTGGFAGVADRHSPKLQTVTLRLNYRFGGPAGGVVARY